jgi:hypothetical protein
LIKKIIVIAIVAVVAIIAGAIIFSMQRSSTEAVPNVKFVSFGSDKQEIRVGESSNISFNVQNSEDRAISDARIVIVIEPSGYEPYLLISNRTIDLPTLFSKDARTGDITIQITAAESPAKEAVYTVKAMLFAEGVQSDIKQFDLKVRQE